MSDKESNTEDMVKCPICDDLYSQKEIEEHANKCIFLNCSESKSETPRKRVRRSPSWSFKGEAASNQSYNKSNFVESTNSKRFTNFKNKSDALASGSTSNGKQTYDPTSNVPLAVHVRPKTLSNFFGQCHILGEGSVLRLLLEQVNIPNMILWGPPGCGKTSLAHIVQQICKENSTKWKFVSLCAATAGVKEVQNITQIARNDLKFSKKTVLFMDEIHRFNKKQQDVFLMSVEKGEIVLIGATTENPSFSINGALLSRCRVVVFEKLNSEQLNEILTAAVNSCGGLVIHEKAERNVKMPTNTLTIEDTALKWIADISDGDARTALNNLELVLKYFQTTTDKIVKIEDVEDKLKRAQLLYDKTGEEHYNIISAMHKSIRGSDPNAALYWTTRMILSGEDPRFIARRMVRAASEDIGNADPQALQLAIATMQGCQLIGMPEADVLLAQCAIYLARAPKSREADTALARAKSLIGGHKGPQPVVPMHIRNAPTKLMKELGYGTLKDGTEFTFMPPEYKNVNFFD